MRLLEKSVENEKEVGLRRDSCDSSKRSSQGDVSGGYGGGGKEGGGRWYCNSEIIRNYGEIKVKMRRD